MTSFTENHFFSQTLAAKLLEWVAARFWNKHSTNTCEHWGDLPDCIAACAQWVLPHPTVLLAACLWSTPSEQRLLQSTKRCLKEFWNLLLPFAPQQVQIPCSHQALQLLPRACWSRKQRQENNQKCDKINKSIAQ
jgi:hypothetical protein